MRLNYQQFSTKRYKVLASVCHHGHFSVVSFTFGANDDNDIFEDAIVYDSMRRSTRSKKAGSSYKTIGEQVMIKIQKYIFSFVF